MYDTFAFKTHPEYDFIFIGNRDEFKDDFHKGTLWNHIQMFWLVLI